MLLFNSEPGEIKQGNNKAADNTQQQVEPVVVIEALIS
jgi:hypothetical protein